MAQGISGRQLAKALGVSDTAVRKAAKAGRIKALPDGSYDLGACRAAWAKATDPGRSKVREPANPQREPANHAGAQAAVRTEDDAKAAIALIARVLRDEGADDIGTIDFAKARTADTILKAYERELRMRQRRKELVELSKVKQHVGRAFVGYRQAMQRLPSRFAAQIAAEVGCDPAMLDSALGKVVATVLDELSEPVVRA